MDSVCVDITSTKPSGVPRLRKNFTFAARSKRKVHSITCRGSTEGQRSRWTCTTRTVENLLQFTAKTVLTYVHQAGEKGGLCKCDKKACVIILPENSGGLINEEGVTASEYGKCFWWEQCSMFQWCEFIVLYCHSITWAIWVDYWIEKDTSLVQL